MATYDDMYAKFSSFRCNWMLNASAKWEKKLTKTILYKINKLLTYKTTLKDKNFNTLKHSLHYNATREILVHKFKID